MFLSSIVMVEFLGQRLCTEDGEYWLWIECINERLANFMSLSNGKMSIILNCGSVWTGDDSNSLLFKFR